MIRIKQMLGMLLLFAGLFTATNKAAAQNKLGFISPYDVLSRLPETKKADSALNALRLQLESDNKKLQSELETRSIKFNTDSAKMTTVQKEEARKDLQPLYMKVINFNQTAQKQLQDKEKELFTPIQQRTMEIIQQVATENGYTHVFTRETILIAPPADDLFPLIQKKFNLN